MMVAAAPQSGARSKRRVLTLIIGIANVKDVITADPSSNVKKKRVIPVSQIAAVMII